MFHPAPGTWQRVIPGEPFSAAPAAAAAACHVSRVLRPPPPADWAATAHSHSAGELPGYNMPVQKMGSAMIQRGDVLYSPHGTVGGWAGWAGRGGHHLRRWCAA